MAVFRTANEKPRLAQGNTAEALKAFDAAEKVADAQHTDVALVPIYRAVALIDARRYGDAVSQLTSALQLADSGQLPPSATANVRRQALTLRAVAESRMGDAAAAQKSVASLEQEASTRPDDKALQSSLHLARGMTALAQKDVYVRDPLCLYARARLDPRFTRQTTT